MYIYILVLSQLVGDLHQLDHLQDTRYKDVDIERQACSVKMTASEHS